MPPSPTPLSREELGRSRVRVTFLIDSMEPRAGTERVTATVAGGLAERGFDVEILTLRGRKSGFPLHEGVQLSSLGFAFDDVRLRSQTLPFMRAIRAHTLRRRPHVLIAVDTFLSLFAFPAVLGLGIRRVAWEHFHYHHNFGMRSRQLARPVAARLGHEVVVLTGRDARQWEAALPRARARIRVITNPLPLVPPPVNPYSPERRTVLAAGRLDGQKGFDLLLDAWSGIESDFPEWSLRIVGAGADHDRLRRQAERLGLRRAALPGSTSHIEQEYLSAGIFCLSSRQEGLGMVLMEAQAYGVPAVAFDCPIGPAELLEAGGGVLVEPENVPELTAALRRVMSSFGARREMSGLAFEGARRYEAARVLNHWTDLLTPRADERRHSP